MKIIPNKYGETILFEDTTEGKLISDNFLKPTKSYPGVGKIIDFSADKSGIEAWRNYVGHEEADRIVNESLVIGRSLDDILFEHFKGTNCDIYKDDAGYKLYKQMYKYLSHIQPIALQLQVFSNKLKAQGYVDCLCYWKGELTLLDFKQARKHKKDEHLEGYWKQCAFYCMMLYELYGIKVKNMVLLIGMRNSMYPDIRTEHIKNWISPCVKASNKFYEGK